MRPLTFTIPKPLLKIGGKPIIDRIISVLPEEITELVVVVRYLGDQIKNYLGGEFAGRRIHFAEGSEKGTAYSFLAARDFFRNGERFLFIYGDELVIAEDVISCLEKDLGIVVFESDKPQLHGMVDLNKDGSVGALIEKPQKSKSILAVDGVMVLNSDIFNYVPAANETGEYYFTSLLNQFVNNKTVWPVKSVGFIGDITTPEDIGRIEKILKDSRYGFATSP